MTTAHRPTWAPARGGGGKLEGGLGGLSKQTSVRDQHAHTKLKVRQDGQGTVEENAVRNFRRELEEKEAAHHQKRAREQQHDDDLAIGFGEARERGGTEEGKVARPRVAALVQPNALDADDPLGTDESESESESESEGEDDTAALLAELEKIKRERAEEQARKDAIKAAEEDRVRVDTAMQGNPLLRAGAGNFTVKRRWDDDVVFKNCARQEENKKASHFINDTLRSDFQKKFLDKYIH